MLYRRSATRWPARMLGLASITALASLFAAGPASAVTFNSSPAKVTIADATTDGTPKASTPTEPTDISVANVTGPVTKVTATLNGFAHGCPTDVDVLLVGPLGQKSVLMSDIGDCTKNKPLDQTGGTRADIDLTFDDSAATTVPCLVSDGGGGTPVSTQNMSGGTFKPTDGPPRGQPGTCAFAGGTTADSFAVGSPVGPVGPYPTGLATFNGVNPNGAWHMYVVDQFVNDFGHLTKGWTLNLTVAPPTLTAPAIVGTPQVGQTLSAASGQITNGGVATWEWKRCDAGGTQCPTTVSTTPTYTPTDADKGLTLKLIETATNSGGSVSATSAASAIVAPPIGPQVPNIVPSLATRTTKTKQKVLTQGGLLAAFTSNVNGDVVGTATVNVPNLAKVYKF
jgi:hypothetical protein